MNPLEYKFAPLTMSLRTWPLYFLKPNLNSGKIKKSNRKFWFLGAVWIALKWRLRFKSAFCPFFFFCFSRWCWPSQQWIVHLCTVHGSHRHQFSATFSLKMGPTVLFTHLKIILLQCFQFSVFSFSKISSIQTDPYILTIISK